MNKSVRESIKYLSLTQKCTRIMRHACFMLIFVVFQSAAASYAQQTRLDLNANQSTLKQVFKEIESKSEFTFFYNDEIVDVTQVVSVHAENETIENILNQILVNYDYVIENRNILLIPKTAQESNVVSTPRTSQKTTKTITGTVTDDMGEPIIGANVVEKGTVNGTVTDIDGDFSLLVSEDAILVFSYIGYVVKEVPVKDQLRIAVKLSEDSQSLDEIIVTALGIKRSEKGLGYAVQKIDGDQINVVKNVDMASGLVGKVAGMNVKSSTEFNEAPSISLRGEEPLIVIDGVPCTNISLRDIASDDVENMNILKGATASALYGSRGGNGAIIITTKRGNKQGGLQVTVNSNTMFNAGHLALPEVQSSYSSGGAGRYGTGDYVWGDKLDIGRTAVQYNPYTYEWEEKELVSKGKNNLKNFLRTSLVTNNNVNVSYQGENSGFRTSLTHVYNKGQYPNSDLNKITYTVGGNAQVGKFGFEGNMTYNKRFYPNNSGTGYGPGGYIYNLLVWSGAEYDIRDYRRYWVEGKENVQQNWMDNNWYDNPYFIANEIQNGSHHDATNGFLSMKYDILPWLNVTFRSGFEHYSTRDEKKHAMSAISSKKGYYEVNQKSGFNTNNDLLIMADYKYGRFSIDGMVGGTIFYRQGSNVWGSTKNGLSIPGFYSLNASVDPASTGQGNSKKQVNSVFGKATLAWESKFFVDVTARNDWSSTLPESTRSYFYPSVAGSIVLSEIFELPSYMNFLKLRGSWTKTKKDLSIYEINTAYSLSTNIWDGLNAAYYPGVIRGLDLRPESSRTYEMGFSANFLQNRVWTDFTYYNRRRYDFAVKAAQSDASGFSEVYVNTDEELERRGFEVVIGAKPIKTKDFEWEAVFNWSSDRQVYKKLDPSYSSKYPWIKKGSRTDWTYSSFIWDTDASGNVVHGENGLPVSIDKIGKMGYSSPDWFWGFTNTFKYKNLTLDVSIDGCVGGTAYNRTEQSMWNSGSHIKSDNHWRYDEVVNNKTNYVGNGVKVISGTIERDEFGYVISDDRVYAVNDIPVSYENYMRLYHENSHSSAPQNFYSRTYIKLREVALSYKLPFEAVKKAGINDLTVGFVGNNLLLWTKEFKYSDPDKGTDNLNSPSIRYVGFNLKFSF